jgi:hypothetical protein
MPLQGSIEESSDNVEYSANIAQTLDMFGR